LPEPEGSFGLLVARHRTRLGLSQAGLADLAGCSRQYIAQLEAGRKHHPSLRLTHALANALQLSGEERARFFATVGHFLMPPGAPALSHEGPVDLASAQTEAGSAVARFEELMRMTVEAAWATRLPAYVHDSLWRLHGWNEAAVTLFEVDPARISPGQVSILDFLFDPEFKQRLLHWETLAKAALAQFKRDSRARIRQPDAAMLLRRVRRLPEFRRLWRLVKAAPDGAPVLAVMFWNGTSLLRLRVLRLRVLDHPDVWFNIFLPVGPSDLQQDRRFLPQSANFDYWLR
jgi:transcriptional regulator with XRE-family HTH domain